MHEVPVKRQRSSRLAEWVTIGLIVGVTALVAAPRLGLLREDARRMACMANLERLGTALLAYTNDYDGRLPQPWFGIAPGPGTGHTWLAAVAPYVASDNWYRCPSAPVTQPGQPGDEPRGETDYGLTLVHSAAGPPTPPFAGGVTLGPGARTVARPADTLLLVEVDPGRTVHDWPPNRHNYERGDAASRRHLGESWYFFADGHLFYSFPGDFVCAGPYQDWPDGCHWSIE